MIGLYGYIGILKNLQGASAGAIYFIVIILIGFFVMSVAAEWKIFSKAHEAGWEALVPILDIYTLYKIAWRGDFAWMYIALILLGNVLRQSATVTGSILMLILSLAFGAAAFVVHICFSVKLSKAFGYDGRYALGIIFIPKIFLPVLAFDNSTYVRFSDSDHTAPCDGIGVKSSFSKNEEKL